MFRKLLSCAYYDSDMAYICSDMAEDSRAEDKNHLVNGLGLYWMAFTLLWRRDCKNQTPLRQFLSFYSFPSCDLYKTVEAFFSLITSHLLLSGDK